MKAITEALSVRELKSNIGIEKELCIGRDLLFPCLIKLAHLCSKYVNVTAITNGTACTHETFCFYSYVASTYIWYDLPTLFSYFIVTIHNISTLIALSWGITQSLIKWLHHGYSINMSRYSLGTTVQKLRREKLTWKTIKLSCLRDSDK